MILYHGSENIISVPVFGQGNRHNGYGYGIFRMNLRMRRFILGGKKNGTDRRAGNPDYLVGKRDINKAGVETVARLANVLGCKIED